MIIVDSRGHELPWMDGDWRGLLVSCQRCGGLVPFYRQADGPPPHHHISGSAGISLLLYPWTFAPENAGRVVYDEVIDGMGNYSWSVPAPVRLVL